jgi:hypothetical protein
MKPIEYRSDIEYLQAARCVEYRLPNASQLKKQGYVLALGLRYGLVAIAATYHLLEIAGTEDERLVLNSTRSWARIVEDHVRFELLSRIPFQTDLMFPAAVSRCAERPLRIALPLLKQLSPLETCLEEAAERYISENIYGIRMNWPWYRRKAAVREFRRHTQTSLTFALHFFERRQYDLDEVPEIALLGE